MMGFDVRFAAWLHKRMRWVAQHIAYLALEIIEFLDLRSYPASLVVPALTFFYLGCSILVFVFDIVECLGQVRHIRSTREILQLCWLHIYAGNVAKQQVCNQLGFKTAMLDTDLHRSNVSGVERAMRSPTVLTSAKINNALGVDPAKLL